MKSKIIITIFIYLAFIQSVIVASPITKNTAELVAKNFYYAKSTVIYDQITFNEEFIITSKGNTMYYVFNLSNDQGFVIVAADDRVYPILGYSINSCYKHTNKPPAFVELSNNYINQISYILENNLPGSQEINDTWQLYKSENYSVLRKNHTRSYVVDPLLGNIAWDQKAGWNEECPKDDQSKADNEKVFLGCIPAALGQIMKYYHHPYMGTGTFSYNDLIYGTQSVDFNTIYDWSEMLPANPTPETTKLLYHLAVGVETEFSINISTSNIPKAIYLLNNHFKYKSATEELLKGNFTETQWVDKLKDELDNNRPVLLSGTGTYGHGFVCDGYDDSNPVMFHFNWGWAGDNNGNFLTTKLNPGIFDFSNNQKALVGIEPDYNSEPASNFTSDLISVCGRTTVNFYDQSSNVPDTWSWTFQGGKPDTSTSKNPSIEFRTPGSYTVSLTASNSFGSGSTKTKTSYLKIYKKPTIPICQPQSQYLLDYYWYGIYNVTFGKIYNTTFMKLEDRGYHDYSCSHTTLVSTTSSTDLTLTVGRGLSGETKVRAFIDYNNDGDFEDQGESILTETVEGPETSKLTFTTSIPVPGNVLENTLLTMRIMTDQEPITGSCFEPYTGQVEDYGICFSSSYAIEKNEINNCLKFVKIYSSGADIYINFLNKNDIHEGFVTVYNLLGEIMFQTNLQRNNSKISIDNITDGIYIVRVLSGNNIICKPVYLNN